jgi:hypothetical protein
VVLNGVIFGMGGGVSRVDGSTGTSAIAMGGERLKIVVTITGSVQNKRGNFIGNAR